MFLKDTRQHNTWKFYGEQTRDNVLAYAVELKGTERGKLKGDLFMLDYQQHFRGVKAIHTLEELRDLPPMERRDHPAFRSYFNTIWKELDVNV